jgi:hypothetical protein
MRVEGTLGVLRDTGKSNMVIYVAGVFHNALERLSHITVLFAPQNLTPKRRIILGRNVGILRLMARHLDAVVAPATGVVRQQACLALSPLFLVFYVVRVVLSPFGKMLSSWFSSYNHHVVCERNPLRVREGLLLYPSQGHCYLYSTRNSVMFHRWRSLPLPGCSVRSERLWKNITLDFSLHNIPTHQRGKARDMVIQADAHTCRAERGALQVTFRHKF